MAPPPAPEPLAPHERAELAAARKRLAPKWAAMDALIEDFHHTDRVIRR